MSEAAAGGLSGLDLPAVQRFFDAHVPDVRGPVRADLLLGGRSNLTYVVTDGSQSWVLRRPPLGTLTPSAHDMAREYRVVQALQGTAVPVARTVASCEDPSVLGVPFTVVEHVSGAVLRTRADLERYDDEQVRGCAFALVDILVALHQVPFVEIGLGDLGRPQGFLTRQVARWHDQWRRVRTRELADVEDLHARLADGVPVESGTALVHGDFRVDNAIVDGEDPGSIRALVDWEMATLGDPLADLGLHLVYRDPAFEPVLPGSAASVDDRMPSPDELAHRYADRSDQSLDQLPFYVALGYFKAAVIAEGIHARHVAGDSVGTGYERVGAAVPDLAVAGRRTLG